MDFESLPVGTESLLNRLGYGLDATRSRWMADGFVPAARMTPDQIRYRKHQALYIREFGNKFFKGERDE